MPFCSREISPAVLERDPEVSCVMDAHHRIVYCNPAWDRFAELNGGMGGALASSVLGRDLLDFIPTILKAFYAKHLETSSAGFELWTHSYECSTPDKFRVYALQALRLKDSGETLLCHTLMEERPHWREVVKPDWESHAHEGSVRMCAHCRRTHRNSGSDTWDWVPEFLAHAPQARVDDLCPTCKVYYDSGVSPWREAR